MRKSSLVGTVRKSLMEWGVPSAGQKVVVGLSGGADSVALLDALLEIGREQGFQVVAAHLDHGLRPDSARDAGFCDALCRRLGIPFHTAAADVRSRARREKRGLEDAARQERYLFLRAVKSDTGAVAIAVAHTLNDQAETVLLRLLRGAGSLGLSAMRARAGDIVRPLLDCSRQTVLAHLRQRGLDWREDPSNTDAVFLRNRVRHELLPYLEAHFNPRVRETLVRTAGLLAEEHEFLEQIGRGLFDRAARAEDGGLSFSRVELREAGRPAARAVLRHGLTGIGGLAGISSGHIDRVIDLAASKTPSGRRLPLPGGREVVFRFDRFWIGPRALPVASFARALPVPGIVDIPGGMRVVAQPAEGPTAAGEHEAVVPADRPLEVRTRRPGDRVRMGGRDRSLKRFLMERRVPADRRSGLPLVASGTTVLWVPGQPMGGWEAARFARISIERTASPSRA